MIVQNNFFSINISKSRGSFDRFAMKTFFFSFGWTKNPFIIQTVSVLLIFFSILIKTNNSFLLQGFYGKLKEKKPTRKSLVF